MQEANNPLPPQETGIIVFNEPISGSGGETLLETLKRIKSHLPCYIEFKRVESGEWPNKGKVFAPVGKTIAVELPGIPHANIRAEVITNWQIKPL